MIAPANTRRVGRIVANDSRNKLISAVHVACKRLGLDEDARRDLQVGATGKRSLCDMTLAEIGKVLDRLNKDRAGSTGHRTHAGKVRALWWTLYWLGAINDPSDRAIDAFVARQARVSALRFLDHRSASAVIEALKSWAEREGVVWPDRTESLGDRRAVFDELWRRLDPAVATAIIVRLCLNPHRDGWTAHEWDAAIKALGKRFRTVTGGRATRDA